MTTNAPSTTSGSPFDAPRVYVTSHNDKGEAYLWKKDPIEMHPDVFGFGSEHADVWITTESPADLQNEVDGSKLNDTRIVHPGAYLRFGKVEEEESADKESIDYGIVLKGEITMELGDGSMTTVKQGEVAIQRGTIHAWHNKSTEWCRIMYICIAAKPILVDGKPMEGPLWP
ncbi:hypothetical protein MNV49_003388 [Pseudohyphozyma bogoriensis]|nr:hypothetical protein MNV49_003388 [Pseudohyphozyma bogoriensis]